MLQDRRLLIVHQDLGRPPAEPLEAADQALVGMLGILTVGAPEVEPPREAQRVHDDVHRGVGAGDPGALLGPITRQLSAGGGLESHGRPPHPQGPLRADIVPQDRELAGIALRLQLPEDHHRVPDVLGQEPIDVGSIGIEPTAPAARARCRGSSSGQRPSHRPGMHPQLVGNVTLIESALRQRLNHHTVLPSQHPSLLRLDARRRDIVVGAKGTFQFGVLGTDSIGADIGSRMADLPFRCGRRGTRSPCHPLEWKSKTTY
jgi:hypothetical protein